MYLHLEVVHCPLSTVHFQQAVDNFDNKSSQSLLTKHARQQFRYFSIYRLPRAASAPQCPDQTKALRMKELSNAIRTVRARDTSIIISSRLCNTPEIYVLKTEPNKKTHTIFVLFHSCWTFAWQGGNRAKFIEQWVLFYWHDNIQHLLSLFALECPDSIHPSPSAYRV